VRLRAALDGVSGVGARGEEGGKRGGGGDGETDEGVGTDRVVNLAPGSGVPQAQVPTQTVGGGGVLKGGIAVGDVCAHSVVGTVLVRRDAVAVVGAEAGEEQVWAELIACDAMQQVRVCVLELKPQPPTLNPKP
jgi:hypothetical protein